jgi:nucleotide-binding universal stress UspA family protein
LASLRGKANTFAAAHKKEADEALNQLKAAAETAKARLETQQKAGVESWDALKTALEESRAAFDKATRKVIEAFTKAA